MLTDWSALLLRRDFHADPALAASVLSMFSVAMFISRSISDTIMHRVRESTFLLFTAIIIALTIPATCATGSVPLVMAGIVMTGFFVGPLFPLALARGGHVAPQHLAEVAAALSIIGYAAHLWGTATDRFRRRAHQPDLHCCRRRRHCCGSAGQRSKGA